MRRHLIVAILVAVFASSRVLAQIYPDRTVLIDPLADTTKTARGVVWLPGTILYAEFARYSNGSGSDHRWNARTGGALEMVRIDSSWSIAFVGTMELVADPQNDITFNPRAIFWEEGIYATFGFNTSTALQFGYMHRCKHDVDNLEIALVRGQTEQRTLIYGSLSTRLLLRPRRIGSTDISVGAAVRNDFFTTLLDSRQRADVQNIDPDLEKAVDALTLDGHATWWIDGGTIGVSTRVGWMIAAYGARRGFTDRFEGIALLGSLPYGEVGIEFGNPRGGRATLFTRFESVRDDGIVSRPTPRDLVLIGIRVGSFAATW